MKKALEKFGRAALFPLKLILALVNSILRIFGIGPAGGFGTIVPKAPKSGTGDSLNPSQSNRRGLTLEQKLANCPIATIIAYAAAPKEKRGAINLSQLPVVQRAWLKACDEETLQSLAKMHADEAVDFVLAETAKAKSKMLMHLPHRERRQGRETGQNIERCGTQLVPAPPVFSPAMAA